MLVYQYIQENINHVKYSVIHIFIYKINSTPTGALGCMK